jgi:Arc/MetJ family transcription regulator
LSSFREQLRDEVERRAEIWGVYLICSNVYTLNMTKRLVEIDDELLDRARSVMGTETIKATVQAALQRVVDQDTALEHIARLRQKDALDLEIIEEARRPRASANG